MSGELARLGSNRVSGESGWLTRIPLRALPPPPPPSPSPPAMRECGACGTRAAELLIAPRVSCRLMRMQHIAVDLDDARGLASEEIDDVLADDLLAEESAEQCGPKERLRVGGVEAHEASALEEELFGVDECRGMWDLSARSDAGLLAFGGARAVTGR